MNLRSAISAALTPKLLQEFLSRTTRSLIEALLDFFFPPLCLCCKERTHFRYFCLSCWEEIALLDPIERCLICFGERKEKEICRECLRKSLPYFRAFCFEPSLPIFHLLQMKEEALEAFASFFFYQWVELDWEKPDLILSSVEIKEAAKYFAKLQQVPFISALKRVGGKWRCKNLEALRGKVLLFLTEKGDIEEEKERIKPLLSALPKKVFFLSFTQKGDGKTHRL